MKYFYLYLCLAVLALSLGATGLSIAFMPDDGSYKHGIITEFVTRHADWSTAKALFLSYIFLFTGIILSIQCITGFFSKSKP